MKERLLGLLFLGALTAAAVNFAIDEIHAWFFADTLWFQIYWYIPFLLVPLVFLLALAWSLGFFRPKGARLADGIALLVVGLLVYLTLGAGYSCWHYCF
jgi:hypothetical protein